MVVTQSSDDQSRDMSACFGIIDVYLSEAWFQGRQKHILAR